MHCLPDLFGIVLSNYKCNAKLHTLSFKLSPSVRRRRPSPTCSVVRHQAGRTGSTYRSGRADSRYPILAPFASVLSLPSPRQIATRRQT
ncbi:hypothetical protein RSAG8_10991, partial [Rhizoctonia solani AG-8 WAC10335]